MSIREREFKRLILGLQIEISQVLKFRGIIDFKIKTYYNFREKENLNFVLGKMGVEGFSFRSLILESVYRQF